MSGAMLKYSFHLRMVGSAVLKVKPKTTEIPAARPAVEARSFWEAISPTKAQPIPPTSKNGH